MTPHDDFMASFGFAQEGAFADELAALAAFAQACAAQFRYWEILYVAGEDLRAEMEAASGRIAQVKNLRVLLVDDGASYYKRRRIAASEAIGDVVVLSAFHEAAVLDLGAFAVQALETNRVILATREGGLRAPSAHDLLNLLSAYKVNRRDLRTLALPRASLTKILARPSASVELRFEAKREFDRYVRKPVSLTTGRRSPPFWQRMELVSEIISASAPRLLRGYALVSFLTAVLAGVYALYACAILLSSIEVERGWFTTAIAQAGSVGFIALGFTIFSLAIARSVEQAGGGGRDVILDEIGAVAFFERADDLNVDYGEARPHVGPKA